MSNNKVSVEPELTSVKLDEVTSTTSLVEVVYRAPIEFEGIELMGVDAGLSWMKGESISLEMEKTEEDIANYRCILEIADSCEFRARGYDDEGDRWEAGLSNHTIQRNEDGTITFSTELDQDLYYFKGSLPTDFNPKLEEAHHRLINIEEEDVPLYQALVDLSLWIDQVFENPLEEDYIYPLSGIIRHLKRKSRALESKKVDNVVRPVLKALFFMYKSALEFHKDDIRFLTGDWLNHEYDQLIHDLPNQVKELVEDPEIGTGKDNGDRFKELLQFIS